MKQLSLWAHRNKTWARLAVIACHLLLASLAYFLASQMVIFNVLLPADSIYAVSLIFLVIVLVYRVAGKTGHIPFAKKKAFHFLIVICSFFCMLISWTDFLVKSSTLITSNELHAAIEPVPKSRAVEILELMKHRDRTSLTKEERRILKKELRHQLKVYGKATLKNDKTGQGNAGYIILAILVVLGISILLAALICGILCGGMEAIAVILILAGVAALIFALLEIFRSMRKKKEAPPVLNG